MSAEQLLILLNSNTTLIFIQDIVKAVLYQLVTSIKAEGTSHGPFQRQCFQGYFDSARNIFSSSKKEPFSQEKVVITQSDACR